MLPTHDKTEQLATLLNLYKKILNVIAGLPLCFKASNVIDMLGDRQFGRSCKIKYCLVLCTCGVQINESFVSILCQYVIRE